MVHGSNQVYVVFYAQLQKKAGDLGVPWALLFAFTLSNGLQYHSSGGWSAQSMMKYVSALGNEQPRTHAGGDVKLGNNLRMNELLNLYWRGPSMMKTDRKVSRFTHIVFSQALFDCYSTSPLLHSFFFTPRLTRESSHYSRISDL